MQMNKLICKNKLFYNFACFIVCFLKQTLFFACFIVYTFHSFTPPILCFQFHIHYPFSSLLNFRSPEASYGKTPVAKLKI